MTKWAPIENKQKVFFDNYPGYLSSHDFERANDEKLAQLAALIRQNSQ